MLYHIDGTVAHIEAGLAVIDCGGVGYALYITSNTLSRLRTGERAKLYVQEYIREEIFDLYGFATPIEKRSFLQLLSVSGVGPRAALSILSSGTPESLALAIITGDEKALTVAPGIGKKIAQRIILELRDKIAKEAGEVSFPTQVSALAAPSGSTGLQDAIAALSVLGYGSAEISEALMGVDTAGLTTEEIIRAALQNRGKK